MRETQVKLHEQEGCYRVSSAGVTLGHFIRHVQEWEWWPAAQVNSYTAHLLRAITAELDQLNRRDNNEPD